MNLELSKVDTSSKRLLDMSNLLSEVHDKNDVSIQRIRLLLKEALCNEYNPTKIMCSKLLKLKSMFCKRLQHENLDEMSEILFWDTLRDNNFVQPSKGPSRNKISLH
jgi:hypothetical protein